MMDASCGSVGLYVNNPERFEELHRVNRSRKVSSFPFVGMEICVGLARVRWH